MSDYFAEPGTGNRPLVDVIIPALNEADTIEQVVKTFRASPRIGSIIVVSDLSRDRTSPLARRAGAVVVKGPGKGKGEAMMRGLREVTTHRVIFADADLTGLTVRHVNALAEPAFGQLVGFRDTRLLVKTNLPPIAGERSLPTRFVRSLRLEGYGAETQINAAVAQQSMRSYHFFMLGVKGKMRAGPLRLIDVAPYAAKLHEQLVNYPRMVLWLPPVSA